MKVIMNEKLIDNTNIIAEFNNNYEVFDDKLNCVSKTGTLFTLEKTNEDAVKIKLTKMTSKENFEVFATKKISKNNDFNFDMTITDNRKLSLNFSIK